MTLADVIARRDAIIEASVVNPKLAARLERELHADVLLHVGTHGADAPTRSMCRAAHSTTALRFER